MQAPPPQYNDSPESHYANHSPRDPAMRPPQMSQVQPERYSTASSNAPFSAIGALLSQPYDSDDEDGRSIRNPHAYQGQAQGDMRRAVQSREGADVHGKVQSYEGDVGGKRRSIVHFPGPQIGHSSSSGHARAPPPAPMHQQQHQQQGGPRYPHPSHPGPRSPHPHRPQPTLNIPAAVSNKSRAPLSPYALPKPSTPISPALAAAPDYFTPPG